MMMTDALGLGQLQFVVCVDVGMLAQEDVALGIGTKSTYWSFIGGIFIPPFKILPGPQPSVDKFYESDAIGEGLLFQGYADQRPVDIVNG